MRYRDLETGTFITRDPAGFIDGPNVYAYVQQNPWTKFDPEGLWDQEFGPPTEFQMEVDRQTRPLVGATVDFVKPTPVQQYRAANQGAATMFDPEASTLERVGGGFSYLGHSIGAVLECVPFVSGVEKLGTKLLGKAETSVATKLESSASKALADTAETVKKVSPKSLVSRQGPSEMTGSKVKKLTKDMKENGFDPAHPIEVAEVDGKKIIIDGHHRAEAAARAGIKEVPVKTTPVTSEQAEKLSSEAAEAAAEREARRQ